MQDWEQADDTSNRILTSSIDGNGIEATKFKVLQLICRRGQVIRSLRLLSTIFKLFFALKCSGLFVLAIYFYARLAILLT